MMRPSESKLIKSQRSELFGTTVATEMKWSGVHGIDCIPCYVLGGHDVVANKANVMHSTNP